MASLQEEIIPALIGLPADQQALVDDTLEALDGTPQFSRLGGNTGQYFLRWVGWDSYIVSSDMVAALRDAGLDISEKATSKKDREKIQGQLNVWAAETGLPYVHLSRILAMSTGPNRTAEELRAYMDDGE